MKVEVIKPGNPRKQVELADGATVTDAVKAAGYAGAASINGTTRNGGDPVAEGDVLFVTPKVEGGAR